MPSFESHHVHLKLWTSSRFYQVEYPNKVNNVILWDGCVDTFTKARYPDSTLKTSLTPEAQSVQVIVSPLTSIASQDYSVHYGQEPSAALSTVSKLCVRVGFMSACALTFPVGGSR